MLPVGPGTGLKEVVLEGFEHAGPLDIAEHVYKVEGAIGYEGAPRWPSSVPTPHLQADNPLMHIQGGRPETFLHKASQSLGVRRPQEFAIAWVANVRLMVRGNVDARVEVRVWNELARPLSVLRFRHLHQGRTPGLMWPSGRRPLMPCVARGLLCQLGRHAEAGACASCDFDSEAFAAYSAGAGPRIPTAPRARCLWRPRPPAPVPPGTRANSSLEGAFLCQGVLVRACGEPVPAPRNNGDHPQPATLGNVQHGVGREGTDTFLEVVRKVESGTGDAEMDAASGGLALRGPMMQSPTPGRRAGVGWKHLLHVRAPSRRNTPHVKSVQVTRSTATRRARVGSSTGVLVCCVVKWRMRPGIVANPRRGHLLHQ